MKSIIKSGLVAMLGLVAVSAHAAESKPNIVVVMADDIGLGDISCYRPEGTKKKFLVETPNIDQLSKEGMRFSDAHSPASLCAPTRFSMLTGNFSFRNFKPFGVWTPDADSGIEPKFTTSARIAKAGGYHTSFFGKWGLGSSIKSRRKPSPELTEGALHFGFDYAFELPQGIQSTPFAFYENQKWVPLKPDSTFVELKAAQLRYEGDKNARSYEGLGDSNWDPSLAGPMLVNKAVDYIGRQTSEHPDEPFFMYYCSQAVHLPHTPPAELDGVKIAGATETAHTDMVLELDVQIGMIVKGLKMAGVYDNTLFIFTSDNGGLSSSPKHASSNELSGKKGSVNEGGHRVPFIAVWAGKIKPGSQSSEPIVGHDVVATIASLAGQPIDHKVVMDSMNLLPLLTGGDVKERHSNLLHQSARGPLFALRDGPWKLIMGSKSSKKANSKDKEGKVEDLELTPVALFNLDDNPGEDESKNLITNPEQSPRVKEMQTRYLEIRSGDVSTIISSK